MKRADANKLIQLLAYHVNGDEWNGTVYEHVKRRYCTERAVEAAALVGKQYKLPKVVFRKLRCSQLSEHVAGKTVCTSADERLAVTFDLATSRDNVPPWVVVRIDSFDHVLDVTAAFNRAAKYASFTHKMAARGYTGLHGNGNEAEHVVTLATDFDPSWIIATSCPFTIAGLEHAQQKAVLTFMRRHCVHEFRSLEVRIKQMKAAEKSGVRTQRVFRKPVSEKLMPIVEV